jgi:hypothetical protein
MNFTVKDMGKEAIKTEGCKLVLDVFQFAGINRHHKIQNNRGMYKLRCK